MKRHQWIGYATAAWSLCYGLLGLYWALGGAGFPFGTGDPELMAEPDFAFKVSLLGKATPEAAGPVIAVLGLLGAGAGVLMARGWSRGPARWLLPAFAWTMSVGLALVVQDYRTLIVVAYAPIMLVGKAFGLFEGSGWSDLLLVPRLNLLVCLLAGIAWALTAVAYRRAVTGACTSCGRVAQAAVVGRGPVGAAKARAGSEGRADLLERIGRPATWVAFAIPLAYCVTRWAWALGFSLGIDPEFYQEGRDSGLWLLGAALATLGAVGSVLTLGLVQRWGEVFPRWMVGLRGRRVPPLLAVVPAILVAVLVASAGGMYIRVVLARGGVTSSTWPLELPETLWVLWGAALFVAAIAYHRRRRGACRQCTPAPAARSGDLARRG
ncbi:hypothetical protein [Salininema proteolyticum]|uniref:Uncharacterized protein n=1 Tax=Salininema proteolyticum TaxID=1607685 RepID=A0ABV8U405_9ACTN